jgi:hypothetical protein
MYDKTTLTLQKSCTFVLQYGECRTYVILQYNLATDNAIAYSVQNHAPIN